MPGVHLRDGQWIARARYQPDAGEALEATTEPVVVDQTSSRWMLNLIGLLVILVGLVALAQRLSAQDLREWLRRILARRGAEEPAREPGVEDDEPIEVEALEVPEEARDDIGRERIAGVVWDGWRGQPIPFAVLELEPDRGQGDPRTCVAMSDGRFSSPELEPGPWSLRVVAEGFAPGTLSLEIPHGGQYGYFRLGMVAVPLKIRRFYRHWVRRIRGEDLWGRLSPRQIEGRDLGGVR